MKKLVDLAIVSRLDSIIRTGATGSYAELAKKLKISKTTLFETISYLKDEMCAPIIYNVRADSYKYEYIPKFYLGSGVKSNLTGEGEAFFANNGNKHGVSDYISKENDSDDTTTDDLLELSELSDVEGGMEKDVWYLDSIDDDSDDVSIDPNINFNDLFFDD